MEPDSLIGRARAIPRLAVFALVLPLLLGACGGSGNKQAGVDTPSAPVETLYNNGVDALNAQRYQSAEDQFNLVEQNYPYSAWAVKCPAHAGLRAISAEPLHRRHRHAGPLHPVASDASRHRLRLLPARALLSTSRSRTSSATRGHRQDAMTALQEVVNRFPDTAYARDARLKIDLCPRPSGRQGDGDRPLVPEASTSMRPRSAVSSAWSTISRPPTTCRRRWIG